MNRKILNCISTIDEFNIVEYNHLGIGVEIQDFTEPNLTNEEVKKLYKLLDKYSLNPVIALEYKVDHLENEINDLLL